MSSRTTPTDASPKTDFATKIKAELQSLQLVWFVGHLLTVVNALSFFLGWGVSYFVYKRALRSAALVYIIVIYKTHGIKPSKSYLLKLITDENFQYLALALLLGLFAPTSLALVPFTVFAAFHSLNYFRQAFLPFVASGPTYQRINTLLGIVNSYQSVAVQQTAIAEILVFFALLILAFQRRASFLSPVMYVQWLRIRFMLSPTIKQAFRRIRQSADVVFLSPSVPDAVRNMYMTVSAVIIKYGSPPNMPSSAAPRTTQPTGNRATSAQ